MKISKVCKIWLKLIPSILMLLSSVILLSYVSYSWIKRDWSPRIEETGITIATGNTLSFIFDENADNSVGKSINELLGVDDFKLKSVSNATGKSGDFFSMTPDLAGDQYATLHHISRNDISNPSSNSSELNTQLGKQYGYVDVQFTVQAPNNDGKKRYVYIDTSSLFENAVEGEDVISAIRISVTLSKGTGDVTQGQTFIFGSSAKKHYGINNEKIDDGSTSVKYALDGARRYLDDRKEDGSLQSVGSVEIDGKIYQAQKQYEDNNGYLYTFEQFNGSTKDHVLFELENGTYQTITVRIWAEGEDPNCTPAISGKAFNLKLMFSAKTEDDFASNVEE